MFVRRSTIHARSVAFGSVLVAVLAHFADAQEPSSQKQTAQKTQAAEQSSVRETPATTTQYESEKSVKITRDITYATVVEPDGSETPLHLDIYLPNPNVGALEESRARVQGSEKPPLLVWIHGGGWRGGSRGKPPVRRLVEHGYAIASISYRFTDQAIFPAQIHDCKAAVRFLRAHAGKYGYDAKRIGVGGSSAGGHLALLLGISCGVPQLEGDLGEHLEVSSCVSAIVDYFGPSDFVLRGKSQPEMAYSDQAGSYALLGGKDGKIDSAIELAASPAEYARRSSPPLLVFHGELDSRVLMDQSERIVELYRTNERPVDFVRVPDAGHGGLKFFMDDNFRRLVDFLDKYLR